MLVLVPGDLGGELPDTLALERNLVTAFDRAAQDRLDGVARRLIRASNLVAGLLRTAVRFALFSAGAKVKMDSELLSSLRERFWADTEAAFFDALRRVADLTPAKGDAEGEGAEERIWHGILRNVALRLFDEAAPLSPDAVPMVRAGETVPRLIRARRELLFALQGYGRDGAALFEALGMPSIKPARKGSKE